VESPVRRTWEPYAHAVIDLAGHGLNERDIALFVFILKYLNGRSERWVTMEGLHANWRHVVKDRKSLHRSLDRLAEHGCIMARPKGRGFRGKWRLALGRTGMADVKRSNDGATLAPPGHNPGVHSQSPDDSANVANPPNPAQPDSSVRLTADGAPMSTDETRREAYSRGEQFSSETRAFDGPEPE
jgi:hypothetical protein